MDYVLEMKEGTTNETYLNHKWFYCHFYIYIYNCAWFFEKAQIMTLWNHNDIPKGHQQCWTFRGHKETFTTWIKETGRTNILSFYVDKSLVKSGFQIICWTTEKFRNPDCSSGKTDFSSMQVINLCLAFQIPSSSFPSVLAPCSYQSLQLLLVDFPSNMWLLFSYFCISKPW